jgi:hypothetical protein
VLSEAGEGEEIIYAEIGTWFLFLSSVSWGLGDGQCRPLGDGRDAGRDPSDGAEAVRCVQGCGRVIRKLPD